MPEKDPMKEFREALDDLEKCLFACEMEGWEDTAQTDAKAARARVEKLHEEALADAASSHEAGLTTSKCLAEEEADNDRLKAELASTRKALEDTRDELRRLRYKFWDNRRLTLGPATAPHLGNKALREVRELETAICKALEEAHARQKSTEAGE